jgi:hypothetical protein
MLADGFNGFLIIWVTMLVLVYSLAGRFIGITLFFAATTTLYVLLPSQFFPNDADIFPLLLSAVVLGVAGFYVGLTAFSGLSERRLFGSLTPRADLDQIARCSAILFTLAIGLLFALRPSFAIDLGTYQGRVDFSGNYGPLVFLLNQGVIAVAVLIIWAYRRQRFVLATLFSVAEVAWAVYSSAKISLLAACAAWLAIALFANWGQRVRSWIMIASIGVLLPCSLLLMMTYAVLRSGVTDVDLALTMLSTNIDRLGEAGVDVGDFSGPYWVFTQHLRDQFLDLTLGSTYFEQLLVLIPRALRGEFLDLTDAFAKAYYGAAYLPGLGFAFSPWAEGYMNFRVAGFFVQGLLFGLFSRFLLQSTVRLIGLNEIALFFQIFMITYFERNHFIGQLKATVVFCLPFLATWAIVELVTRRPPSYTEMTAAFGRIGAAIGRSGRSISDQRTQSH